METNISEQGILIWRDEYSVNVAEIDSQHKKLIGIINALIRSIKSIPDEKVVSECINNVFSYIEIHFATEEKYFYQFNYEGTVAHEAEHRAFEIKIKEITEKYKDDTIALAFSLVDYLEDWFIAHTAGIDKKFAQCFNEHGLK